MFCTECGTRIEVGDAFCANCGTSIDVGITKIAHTQKKFTSLHVLLLVSAVGLGLFVISGADLGGVLRGLFQPGERDSERTQNVPPPPELQLWDKFLIWDSKFIGCTVVVYTYLELENGTKIWRWHIGGMQAPFAVSRENKSKTKLEYWVSTNPRSSRYVMDEYLYFSSYKALTKRFPTLCDVYNFHRTGAKR
jgi:zinc-ribbon domain